MPTVKSEPSMQESEGRSVVPAAAGPKLAITNLPAIIAQAGPAAAFAWEEFFVGQLPNRYTRAAYLRAVRRFLGWVSQHETDLARIVPGLVGRYFDELKLSVPSKKLHLAAIRRFFDVLVQRHVVVLNPAHSVRTERYSATEGRTPEITVEQAREAAGFDRPGIDCRFSRPGGDRRADLYGGPCRRRGEAATWATS